MSLHQTLTSCTLLCGLLLGLSTTARAQAGGIEIFAGETLFAHGTRVSVAHLYQRKSELYSGSDSIPDPLGRESVEQRVVLGYNYGWKPRVTVGALLPVVSRQNELLGTGGPISPGATGLGDLALFGKYRMLTIDGYQRSSNISLIGGLETPTGATGETEGGLRLPTSLQPGSGSWDPFGALAATTSHGRWRFDGLVFYKLNTEGSQDYKDSDLFALGLSAAYRYLHRPYPGASNSARLGLVWRDEGKARRNGTRLVNSGAQQLILRPALGFHPVPAIDISLSVDLPLYQHYEGQQLGFGFRTFIALGYRF